MSASYQICGDIDVSACRIESLKKILAMCNIVTVVHNDGLFTVVGNFVLFNNNVIVSQLFEVLIRLWPELVKIFRAAFYILIFLQLLIIEASVGRCYHCCSAHRVLLTR